MLVVDNAAYRDLVGTLVSTTRRLKNSDGTSLALKTYDDRQLRTAVLTALIALTGETVEVQN